jgi:FKBP-type peptidyl-prolyl cis-trans isomerase FkpA
MRVTLVLSCLILAALVACGDDTPGDEEREIYDTEPPPAEVGPDTAAAATYAPELDVDLATFERTPSGLYVKDLTTGGGPAVAPGQTAVVHYTGWLPDGTQFDSSRDRNEPFAFPIGAGQVIAGWEEGVAGMSVDGRRKLVVPPHLGYGAQGTGGVIPPNATLVFEVELLETR